MPEPAGHTLYPSAATAFSCPTNVFATACASGLTKANISSKQRNASYARRNAALRSPRNASRAAPVLNGLGLGHQIIVRTPALKFQAPHDPAALITQPQAIRFAVFASDRQAVDRRNARLAAADPCGNHVGPPGEHHRCGIENPRQVVPNVSPSVSVNSFATGGSLRGDDRRVQNETWRTMP